MTEIVASRPLGVRDEWMDVPLPGGIAFGAQVHRKGEEEPLRHGASGLQ